MSLVRLELLRGFIDGILRGDSQYYREKYGTVSRQGDIYIIAMGCMCKEAH